MRGGCRYCAGRTRLDEWEGRDGEGFWGGCVNGEGRRRGDALVSEGFLNRRWSRWTQILGWSGREGRDVWVRCGGSREGAKGLLGEGASTEPRDPRGWQAHSARRESCSSDSSPEHAAGWFGEVSAEPAGSVSGCCIRPVADATGWYGCGSWRRADEWADVFDTGAFASSRVTSPNNCSRRTPLSCARRSCTFSLTPRRITVPSSRTRARPARPSSCR